MANSTSSFDYSKSYINSRQKLHGVQYQRKWKLSKEPSLQKKNNFLLQRPTRSKNLCIFLYKFTSQIKQFVE